jgi:hypothetical protein
MSTKGTHPRVVGWPQQQHERSRAHLIGVARRWATCVGCGARIKVLGTRLQDHIRKHAEGRGRSLTELPTTKLPGSDVAKNP